MNNCVFSGRLTRDPEINYTQSNMAVVNFSIAVEDRIKRGDQWEKIAHFFDIVMFGSRGEAFAKHHQKGDRVLLECKAQLDKWQDKQTGDNRQKVKFLANQFHFVKDKSVDDQRNQHSEYAGEESQLDEGEIPF